MTAHEHDMMHEMMLRHALRSAADSIEPRSDGLDRIRTRLRRRPYPLLVAWAEAAWMRLALWLPEGAYSASRQLAGKLRTVWDRFLPAPGSASSRDGQSSPLSLLRPLTAFGIAVFIVAVGAYVAIEVPAVVSPSSGHSLQGGSAGGGSHGHGSGVAGHSSLPFPSTGSGSSTAPTGSAGTSVPCLNQLGPSGGHPSSSPSTSATASPTPTGSGSPSPTGTPTPTPSGTGSSTPTPTGSPSGPAGAGQPTAGAAAANAHATTDALILPATVAEPSVTTKNSPCSTPSPHRTKRTTKKVPSHTASPGIAGSLKATKPAKPRQSSSA